MKKLILILAGTLFINFSYAGLIKIYKVSRVHGDKTTGLFYKVVEKQTDFGLWEVNSLSCSAPGSTPCGWTQGTGVTPAGNVNDIMNEVAALIDAGTLSGSYTSNGVLIQWDGTDAQNFDLEISYEE